MKQGQKGAAHFKLISFGAGCLGRAELADFYIPSTFLSLIQNGSNLVESFLNIIRSYAETPGIFDFKKDQLMGGGAGPA